MARLTQRQQRFCDEYLVDLNGTQAAIRAGYSEKTAEEQASRLLSNVMVQQYLHQRQKALSERTHISQDMVVHELAAIAFANAADYARVVDRPEVIRTEDGAELPLHDKDGKPVMLRTVEAVLTRELTQQQRRAIAAMRKSKDGVDVKLHDKVRALELLGRHLGMFCDRVELTGEVNDPMMGLTTEELRKLIGDE